MSELTRLLELTEQIVPTAFDGLVDVRRRRTGRTHAATAVGLAAAGVVAVVGALALADGDNRTDPAPTPTPTPSELFVVPDGPTTIPVDVQPDDVHGWDVISTVTNAQAAHRGDAELSTTVTVNAAGVGGVNYVDYFCRTTEKDIWLVHEEIDGAGGYGPCESTGPMTVRPADIGQWSEAGPPEQLSVHAWLTRVTPELEPCLEHGTIDECFGRYGQPLAATDAEFGFRIYHHPRQRSVLTLWDAFTFEAHSTIDQKPWIVDHAVLAAAGSDRLAIALPDSRRQRLVGVHSLNGPHWNACIEEHRAELPKPEGDLPWRNAVDEVCGVRLWLRVDGEYVAPRTVGMTDDGRAGFGDPIMYVAPGAHHVTVDVVGDPRNVRYAVVLWKEQVQ
jgi:hypothetical protein